MSHYQPKFKHEAVIKGNIPPKPKRPLTVFNLFSILERNFIVQQNQKRASTPSASTDINTDPYLATRPERYRDVVLPFNWFVVGMNRVKRSKHKVHGVISFNELTKEISNRWKSVDAETKQYCETIAADELQRYQRNMAAYEATYGQDVVNAQKRTRAKNFTSNCIAKNNQGFRNEDIPDCRHAIGSQLRDMENGLPSAVDMGMKVMPSQAAAQNHWSVWNPVQARFKQSNSGEYNHSSNSIKSRGRSPTLSEYLPDDQEAALALVGNNYENILHGEELEKAFDSD